MGFKIMVIQIGKMYTLGGEVGRLEAITPGGLYKFRVAGRVNPGQPSLRITKHPDKFKEINELQQILF